MSLDAWRTELDQPTRAFFTAFAARTTEGPEGMRDATREAIRALALRIGWADYHPHVPHGLLGLGAVWRLRPFLSEPAFRRALATQLHMLAHEGRTDGPKGLAATGRGSGNLANLQTALEGHHPSLALGECLGLSEPASEDFDRLQPAVLPDMANMGHKLIFLSGLRDLFLALERPRSSGRRLLGLAVWLAAKEPVDTFWARRAGTRLGDAALVVSETCSLDETAHRALARRVCDAGLVELLDLWTGAIRECLGTADLLAILVLAAAEKQLDARRDLEGKTGGTFVYLAALARCGARDPRAWVQAAALVNLFPTDEAEDRVGPKPGAETLLDAILDGEAPQAMAHAQVLAEAEGHEALLGVLAEAATLNDPAFNYASQVLTVSAAADLLPGLPPWAARDLLVAQAKSLANGQGSGDLGRLADKAFL